MIYIENMHHFVNEETTESDTWMFGVMYTRSMNNIGCLELCILAFDCIKTKLTNFTMSFASHSLFWVKLLVPDMMHNCIAFTFLTQRSSRVRGHESCPKQTSLSETEFDPTWIKINHSINIKSDCLDIYIWSIIESNLTRSKILYQNTFEHPNEHL